MGSADKNYHVHRYDVEEKIIPERLEKFLNGLKGDVVSIIPNLKKMSLFQIYGITPKVDYLVIVEKVK